ncbi:MAG: hypothetical protein KJ614_03835 [Gammaproteobacteria bacterium]|uniref:hypothetical protein n=1 Tax=Rhodoferax sp. TaxID=50421 RepID=UPI0017D4870A|nr:hypothetical protein [Rhodoferax sp.]MBU3898049.1 hypothetical protein [Gammaproteobacteria bacterium]MBA3058549.1 hypothetical protein [Rhodoferax sp.]MBU3999194.1 hypothetical protein [Gammaproteobacteria bacterium]MBU4081757.1 hypothetical protein [Gammaproteobacteria bacterium]MBU4112750.1 hypothetical protein [Gammaproteobacteria bacterium]
MASNALSSLALVIVVTGLVLLVTGVMLSRRARRYRRRMQALLKLGSQNHEPLAIPAAAWPVLHEAGWRHLSLDGSWFGQPVHIELGVASTTAAPRPSSDPENTNLMQGEITSGNDVRLALKMTHSASRGGTRLLAEQLAQVFVLLLETGLRARTEALSVALAERARLTLYLQHDMRNLAQWVSWVCSDFAEGADAPALLAAARRLQENAPLAQERAYRLIAALGNRPMSDSAREIDLRLAIAKAAHLAGIELNLSGQAHAWIARGLLSRALDNLFSNLAPNWRDVTAVKPTLHLRSIAATPEAPAMAEIEFFSPWPEPGGRIEAGKLFEPFASGRPGGLGLGLYQARKSLREAGGELSAEPGETGLSFLLRMPASTP